MVERCKVLAIDGLGGKPGINKSTQENGNLTEINHRIGTWFCEYYFKKKTY